MLVMCVHCSSSWPTRFGAVSILFSEPKGEGAKPSNTGVFFSPLHSSLMPWAFSQWHSLFWGCAAPVFTWHYCKCCALLKYWFACLPLCSSGHAISVVKFPTWFISIMSSHQQRPGNLQDTFLLCYLYNKKRNNSLVYQESSSFNYIGQFCVHNWLLWKKHTPQRGEG